VGDQVEHLYLCRSGSYCFHNRTFLHFPLQRYDNYPTFALTKAIFILRSLGVGEFFLDGASENPTLLYSFTP
jgi:hypothetical protein